MLDIFVQRMPDYYEQKFKKSLKMQLQTLVHGDFHGGNHMYGTDENHGNTDFKDFRDRANRKMRFFLFKIKQYQRNFF